jgi:hypothetical protein
VGYLLFGASEVRILPRAFMENGEQPETTTSRESSGPISHLRLGVALVSLAVCMSAAVGLGQSLGRLDTRIKHNASLDYLDRVVAGGNGVVGSQALAFQAKAWIPEGDTYQVVFGPDLQTSSELTRPYAGDFLRYLLFPRRQVAGSRWVLCYGCDREAYGGRFETLYDAGEEYTLGRLR